MSRATEDKARGIKRTILISLEDLDFADDIALLSSKQTHLQEKTTRLSRYAQQIELFINTKKMVMRINTPDKITEDGSELEDVESFTYLESLISTEKLHQEGHEIKTRQGPHCILLITEHLQVHSVQP